MFHPDISSFRIVMIWFVINSFKVWKFVLVSVMYLYLDQSLLKISLV